MTTRPGMIGPYNNQELVFGDCAGVQTFGLLRPLDQAKVRFSRLNQSYDCLCVQGAELDICGRRTGSRLRLVQGDKPRWKQVLRHRQTGSNLEMSSAVGLNRFDSHCELSRIRQET